MAGAAATVKVVFADSVDWATDVAVTVTDCAAFVAAGAVYVAEVAVVLDRVPPPETVHVTPFPLESLVRVAVSVTVSAPSTVLADADTATVMGLELPPQPVIQIEMLTKRQTTRETRASFFRDIMRPRR